MRTELTLRNFTQLSMKDMHYTIFYNGKASGMRKFKKATDILDEFLDMRIICIEPRNNEFAIWIVG